MGGEGPRGEFDFIADLMLAGVLKNDGGGGNRHGCCKNGHRCGESLERCHRCELCLVFYLLLLWLFEFFMCVSDDGIQGPQWIFIPWWQACISKSTNTMEFCYSKVHCLIP